MPSLTIEQIAQGLGGAIRTHEGWRALCPCHSDHRPSLDLAEGSDGKALVICRAGCAQEMVIARLREMGLWHNSSGAGVASQHVIRYEYRLEDGALAGVKCRVNAPDGHKAKIWWEGHAPQKPWPLYHIDRRAVDSTKICLVVEGEKTCEAAATLFGDICDCVSFSGTGAVESHNWAPLASTIVVIWPDNDDKGREAALKIATILWRLNARVSMVDVPGDWPRAWDVGDPPPPGIDRDFLRGMITGATRYQPSAQPDVPRFAPRPTTEICTEERPARQWIVENMLPVGFACLAGAPKMGKSFLVTQLCAAVSAASMFLGHSVCPAESLYVDAETDEDGCAYRAQALGWDAGVPGMTWFGAPADWQLDKSGLADLTAWLKQRPKTRLIVCDTVERLTPHIVSTQHLDAYQEGVRRFSAIQKWCAAHRVCLLGVHHTSKSTAGSEVFDVFSGSRGLTGTAETLITMVRDRKKNIRLCVTGRYLRESIDLALKRNGAGWSSEGDYEIATMSDERVDVLNFFIEHPGESLKVAAKKIEIDYNVLRHLAGKLVLSGHLEKKGYGAYYPKCERSVNGV